MDQLWLFYTLVFGAALLGVYGLYWVLIRARADQKAINRRIALTGQLKDATEVLHAMRRERGIESLREIPALDWLNQLIMQSGIRLNKVSLLALSLGPTLPYFMLLRIPLGSTLALPVAVVLSVASGLIFLRSVRSKRIAQFGEQLPDSLDVLVRGLRAGHPFRVSLNLVAREMPDPAGSEFGVVADEIAFGLQQSQAIDGLVDRVGHADLSFFATAINIQHETGGNLAEILARLAQLLRQRMKLRLKIRALSSEGRLSAIALSAAPFVLFGIITLLSPNYFTAVSDHPLTMPVTVASLVLLGVGNFVMFRMVNFKF